MANQPANRGRKDGHVRTNTLLTELWEPSPGAIRSPHLQTMYPQVLEALQMEVAQVPAFGTLDAMIVERIAFTYISIRDRESHRIGEKDEAGRFVGFEHERNYKETQQMWMDMATKVQKQLKGAVNEDEVRTKVLESVQAAVGQVISELPPEVRGTAAKRLAEAFEEAGL